MKSEIRNIVVILIIIVSLIFTNKVYASFAEMDDATSDKQRNEQLQEQEKQDKENFGKSSNNYLKGLSIKGFKLSPEFDKQTIDYTIDGELDVDSIEVSADLDDSRAKISGTGTIKLEPGGNNIRVDVTSENGIVRTYNIKVTRKGQKTTTENKEENTEVAENTVETTATPVQKSNNPKTLITIGIVIAVLIVLYLLANKSKGKRRKKK